MKVGVRVSPLPPFDRMREFVARVRDAGAASVWWPDHLMSFLSPALWSGGMGPVPTEVDLNTYADPFICMAAAAEASGDLLMGTCVTDAVRRMPATLAQAAITLDHLAPGRVVLGLGAGEAANYRPYGWDVASSGARFRQAAAEIRGFFDRPGPDPRGAIVGLRPPAGSRGPRLWLAAHGPRGLDATARYADGWLPMRLDHAKWNAGRTAIRRTAVEAGRDPAGITMALSVEAILQDDHEAAHALLDHAAVKQQCLLLGSEVFRERGLDHPLGRSGLETMVATLSGDLLASAARHVPFDLVHNTIPHGTPADVADVIRGYEHLDHVRVSDLSSLAGGKGGGLGRIFQLIRLLAA